MREQPSLVLIYVVAALNAIGFGLHRPAHESLTPRLVEKEDLPAVSVLASLRGNIGAIGGPAVGGILIAVYGTTAAYILDLSSYLISLFCLWRMGDVPTTASLVGRASGWSGVMAGLQYVRKRRDLWGTYIVDIIAMTFGMPNALFPALAESLGGAKVLGWLYAAPSLGALALTLGSGWTKKIRAYGKVITWSAALWGLAIVGAGWSSNLYAVLFFLALAGAFDMVSAIFRMTMWNETIPDEYRGRMAGVEMISYKSGPLLGQTESGLVAAWTSVRFSIVSG
jgi:MFS family permease